MSAASTRRAARIIGVLFLLTFVTSITAYVLYGDVLDDTNWVIGDASDTAIQVGAFLEVLLVVFNVATAVVLYPVLRRYEPTLALGWVASRIVESTLIAVGAISLLSVMALQNEGIGSNATLVTSAQAFVAVHDWTFLFGPGFCAAATGLLLGFAMLRSGLLPRRLAMIGIVGGSLCLVNAVGALFGGWEQMSSTGGALTLFEAIWEGGILGVYLIVKGFSDPAVRTEQPALGVRGAVGPPAPAA